MFAPDNIPIRSLEISNKFSADLLVKTGYLFMRTIYTFKSPEDLKSQYKLGLDYYLGQTLSRLEAKKRNLHN